jgi:phytanoyl-CoA hydroxylase
MPVKPSSVASQIAQLREVGYSVVPQFLPPATIAKLNEVAKRQLAARAAPLELEADLQYPGAPASRFSTGGETVRRLLDAFDRCPEFAQQAASPAIGEWLEAYFNEPVRLSRAHHNCLMTKHPRYGSLTGWHRDIRYWSFEREDLVSVWMALGEEHVGNGALWFVPGSHRAAFDDSRFDAARFFRADHPQNAALIRSAQSPPLMPGDAVFFHSNTLHSAGRNESEAVKLSLVYTFHGVSNAPKADTRSNSKPEVALSRGRAGPGF